MSSSSKTIRVSCPQCSAELQVASKQLGVTITCSDCLEDFLATASDPSSQQSPPLTITSEDARTNDDGALQRLLNPDFEDDRSASDTIRLDELGEDATRAKPEVLTKDYAFGITCHLCRTRLTMTDADIGKTVSCPDCHTDLRVKEPAINLRKPKAPPQSAEDDEFRLAGPADVETAAPFQSIASDLLSRAEAEAAPPASERPATRSDEGQDALQRAQEDLEEEELKDPPLPLSPFRTRFFAFLLDPNAIGRLVFLAGALWILLGAIYRAYDTTTEDTGTAQFVSVLMRMFSMTFGLVFLAASCTSMQGILQDTSYGMDEVESWPDLNFLDWFGEMLYIVSSLFVSVIVPAFVLGNASGASDVAYWTTVIVVGSCGLIFVFPFLLLSTLESGSPINPLSRPIQRSVGLARERWLQFTMLAAVVVSVGAVLAFIRFNVSTSGAINFGIALGLVVVAAIYFRLLGRLAWCCRVAVADADERMEERLAREES